MNDEQIRELFSFLQKVVGVSEVGLLISRGRGQRLRGRELAMDGVYDPKYRRIMLTINENFPLPDYYFALWLLHELKHCKHPEYSERMIWEEGLKEYEAIYGEPFPERIKVT